MRVEQKAKDHRRMGRTALGLVALLCAGPLAGRAAPPASLDDITKAYRTHYQAVKTLKVVYDETTTPLIDMEVLYECFEWVDFAPTRFTVVSGKNKYYHEEETRPKSMGAVHGLLAREDPDRHAALRRADSPAKRAKILPFSEAKRMLPRVAPEWYWLMRMYDGALVYEGHPGAITVGELRLSVTLLKSYGRPNDWPGGARRSALNYDYPLIIKHDALVEPTDCGGPLVGTDGKVVGINIARLHPIVIYAIPAHVVRKVLAELRKE